MTWISSILRSRRLWGLTGTAAVMYLIVFVGLKHVDATGLLPTQQIAVAIIEVWPRLPFFATHQETDANGQVQTYYTVPTRQFTKAELAKMQHSADGNKASSPK